MSNTPALARSDTPDVYLYGCKECGRSFRSTDAPSLYQHCATCGAMLMVWMVCDFLDLFLPDWMRDCLNADPSAAGP